MIIHSNKCHELDNMRFQNASVMYKMMVLVVVHKAERKVIRNDLKTIRCCSSYQGSAKLSIETEMTNKLKRLID